MRDERPRFSRDSFSRITALRSHRSSPRRFPSVPKTADRRAAFQAARLAAAAALRSLRGDWLGLQARALCSWMSGFAAPGEDSDSPQLDEAVGEPVGKGVIPVRYEKARRVSVAFWRNRDNRARFRLRFKGYGRWGPGRDVSLCIARRAAGW